MRSLKPPWDESWDAFWCKCIQLHKPHVIYSPHGIVLRLTALAPAEEIIPLTCTGKWKSGCTLIGAWLSRFIHVWSLCDIPTGHSVSSKCSNRHTTCKFSILTECQFHQPYLAQKKSAPTVITGVRVRQGASCPWHDECKWSLCKY